jgi:hypothetical protein
MSEVRAANESEHLVRDLSVVANEVGEAAVPAAGPLICWWCQQPAPPPMVCNDLQTIGMHGTCARAVAAFLNPEAAAAPPPLDLEPARALATECLEVHERFSDGPEATLARHTLTLIAEVDRLRSLHAAPEGARLRELATQAAVEAHIEAIRQSLDYLGHVDDMAAATANSLGFQTCPHPDCVLVRSAPAPVVAEGALRALVERWREEDADAVEEANRALYGRCGMTPEFVAVCRSLARENSQRANQLAALLPARPASVKET